MWLVPLIGKEQLLDTMRIRRNSSQNVLMWDKGLRMEGRGKSEFGGKSRGETMMWCVREFVVVVILEISLLLSLSLSLALCLSTSELQMGKEGF